MIHEISTAYKRLLLSVSEPRNRISAYVTFINDLSPVLQNRAFFIYTNMKQVFETYTEEDAQVWKLLFTRQLENLKDKASKDYLDALQAMRTVLHPDMLPNFEVINTWFRSHTGWQIECVPGLIDVVDFFRLLAQKKFPSSTWLREKSKLDYLEEPDMFHDIFGHIPLLANPIYSDFMQAFGQLGCTHITNEVILRELQRLYWFTIEFGLIREHDTERILGAGIASSYHESIASLQNPSVERKPFRIEEILQTSFSTSEPQIRYFVLENLEQLTNCITFLTNRYAHEMESHCQPV